MGRAFQWSSQWTTTNNWSRSTRSWHWSRRQHHTTRERRNHGNHQITQKQKNHVTGQPQHRTLQGRARVCRTSSSARTWEEKQLPDDWTEGVIVKIPKKGALRNCNNWRGVTLLSVPSKTLASSSSGRSLMQWTSDSDKSRQVFERTRMHGPDYHS